MGTQPPSPQRGYSPLPIFGTFSTVPNGRMHQDATCYGGRPQPRELWVRWGPSPITTKGVEPTPQFSAHSYCGRTAGCIKMALGMEVDLDLVHIVLDGDTAPLPQKGGRAPNFRPIFIVAKRLHGSRCHLVRR